MDIKKILSSIFILILVVILLFFFLNRNLNNSSTEKFYHLNSVFFTNYKTQQNFNININSLFIKDTVYCSVDENLQNKIYESVGKTLILEKGVHKSYILKIPSNIKIIIPKDATIKLADDCVINQSSYGEAVGDAVIQINGTKNNLLENIFIELNGVIDGNKSIHPYNSGGIEGIDLKWVKNTSIYGSGSVINANGDGLDIDVSNNCYIEGITFSNNDGGGVHFGSPRPIKSSFNNLIIGCTAVSNGFLHQRSGFDQSWPNINGVTYFDCESKSNFQNWDIQGSGVVILNSISNINSSSKKADSFDDALFYNISHKNNSDFSFNNEFKIKETGYYLLTTKKNHITNNTIQTVNGKAINNTDIISKNDEYQVSNGIYLLNENDVLGFTNFNDDNLSNKTKNINSTKLDLIISLKNLYPKNYDLKIFAWRVKSEINNIIYKVYSFIFK
jgi:hypothetical protein